MKTSISIVWLEAALTADTQYVHRVDDIRVFHEIEDMRSCLPG